MAAGNITRRERNGHVFYEVTVDLGKDPVTGKRRLRSKSLPTKREAREHLAAWLAEIDRGTAVDRSRQTVAEMLHYWLDTYARPNVRPRTYRDYEQTIARHIIPALGGVPVQKLTPAQVQQFYADMLAAGRGPRTVQLCHLRLSQALSQAEDLGLVARNVARKVTPPRAPQTEMETWDAEQARRFLQVARHSGYGPIWLLSLATGMRRGELLGLRWQDVDWERGAVSIRQTAGLLGNTVILGEPKTERSRRTIPVPAAVMQALRDHRAQQNERRLALGPAWADHGLVFAAGNGRPINPNNLRREYAHWVALAGVPAIRIHDQRHTHVTLAIRQGANIHTISRHVGHARTSITMDIYAHLLSEEHADVADRVAAAILPLAEGHA